MIAVQFTYLWSFLGVRVRACRQKVVECDLFVGIYAHRYDYYIPQGETKSITDAWLEEYNAVRPHATLGGTTPNAFAAAETQP